MSEDSGQNSEEEDIPLLDGQTVSDEFHEVLGEDSGKPTEFADDSVEDDE